MSNPNLPISGKYNTYIGARYVPLMGGEWNQDKAYEPLIIVTHQGNSYTSNTFVPAGTDINDKTYWTLTGNYNGQVEQYRSEVEGVKQDVQEVNQKFDQLNSELTETNNNLSETNQNLTDLQNTVNTNKENTDNAISKSNIMLLGLPQPSQTTISCITPYEMLLPGFKTVHQDTGVHDFHSQLSLNVLQGSNIIFIVLDKSNFDKPNVRTIVTNLSNSINTYFNSLPEVDGLKLMPKIWVTLDELNSPTTSQIEGFIELHYYLYQIQTGLFNYSSTGFVYGCTTQHYSEFKPIIQTLCYQICRNVLQTSVSSYQVVFEPLNNWTFPNITVRTEAISAAVKFWGAVIYKSDTPLVYNVNNSDYEVGEITNGVWPITNIRVNCLFTVRDQESNPSYQFRSIGYLDINHNTNKISVSVQLEGHNDVKYIYATSIIWPEIGIDSSKASSDYLSPSQLALIM